MDTAIFGPAVVVVDDASTVMWSIVPVDMPPLARLWGRVPQPEQKKSQPPAETRRLDTWPSRTEELS
jgi:hypothetical protein